MQRIFLLRAYGDFVIALQAISRSKQKIQIVASDHLAPLYNALITAKALYPLPIEFISLGIQQGQLNFFTNKHLFSWDTLKQLSLLKAYIKSNPNKNGVDWLEHGIRMNLINFLLAHRFKAVVSFEAKVYQAYDKWLEIKQLEIQGRYIKSHLPLKIVTIPDARLSKRVIQPAILELLRKYTISKGFECKIARLRTQLAPTDLVYENFESLINIIETADFIICTDSLSAHLASLLKKPHYILYPKGGMTYFFTPYALAFDAAGNFKQTSFTFLN
jgi:hypothetical protein